MNYVGGGIYLYNVMRANLPDQLQISQSPMLNVGESVMFQYYVQTKKGKNYA